MSEYRHPTEQLEGEPDLWYGRFRTYVSLGPARSVTAAYKQTLSTRSTENTRSGVNFDDLNRAPNAWYEARDRWDWERRAHAWDREQREHMDRVTEEWRAGEMQRRQELLGSLFGKVKAAAARLDETVETSTHMRALKDYASAADTYLESSRRECGLLDGARRRNGRPTNFERALESRQQASPTQDDERQNYVQHTLTQLPDEVLAELAAEAAEQLGESDERD